MKRLFKNILIIALFTPFLLKAGEAESRAATELLEACQFDKVMNDSIQSTIQVVKKTNPDLGKHEKVLKKFYNKHMGAQTLRKDVIEMYSEIFTEKELEDIIDFYKSKTGQKALEKLPMIMQRSMELAETRLIQNMGELQEMLSEEITDKEIE